MVVRTDESKWTCKELERLAEVFEELSKSHYGDIGEEESIQNAYKSGKAEAYESAAWTIRKKMRDVFNCEMD